jgi:uncharacterized protein YhaN
MQIRRIQIADFGKLHDMELDFSEGFQTITGENGWGKSTMAAFIKAMLYGMEATTRRSLLENEIEQFLVVVGLWLDRYIKLMRLGLMV